MDSNLGKKIFAFLLFILMVLIGSQINFSQVLGGAPNQTFTAFQFFGPLPGIFLGPLFGAIAVLASQGIQLLVSNKTDWLSLLRLLPMALAAIYFGSKKFNASALISIACMILFWVHPVGQQAWFYALYWTIPLLAMIFFSERLFAKSLGATFTAHSIGSVIWLYAFPSTPAFWIALIPVVAFERGLFALGITFSFIAFNTVLSRIEAFTGIKAEQKYVFSRKMLGI